ncbi:ComF family protein [Leuconostoc koreense]|nr:ComF family protein [Leuconostoc mesenteroides]QGM25101.1 ComF family protein [Leuconostoc mesenteroides subsp. mesenteroides]
MHCALCQTELFEVNSFLQFFGLVRLENSVLCESCRCNFDVIDDQHCLACGRQQLNNNTCYDCRRWQFNNRPILYHRALYQYNAAMRLFMQQYKFNGDYKLRKIFNRELINLVHRSGMDLVVAVPVSHQTMMTRGFNQVTSLLEGIELTEVLKVKVTNKIQQSHLNRKARMKREQPFSIIDEKMIAGQNILLVDDVYTTGNTLHHAANLLLIHGANSVRSISLAR